MQGALCLPLTITPQHHLQAPCNLPTYASPAPPGLGQAMLPTQPLAVQLSLTNIVYKTAQLPDGRVLPPFDGL